MINIYLKEKTEQSKPSISLNIEEVEKKKTFHHLYLLIPQRHPVY